MRNITFNYGDEKVLDNLNLYIRDKEFITLLGPSGCGKTTTLRIIAGFLEPDEGEVVFEGKSLTMSLRTRERSILFFSVMLFFCI